MKHALLLQVYLFVDLLNLMLHYPVDVDSWQLTLLLRLFCFYRLLQVSFFDFLIVLIDIRDNSYIIGFYKINPKIGIFLKGLFFPKMKPSSYTGFGKIYAFAFVPGRAIPLPLVSGNLSPFPAIPPSKPGKINPAKPAKRAPRKSFCLETCVFDSLNINPDFFRLAALNVETCVFVRPI